MSDTLPPAIAADRVLVEAWLDIAKPGEPPPAGVQAAQARCQAWLDEQKPTPAVPHVESAFDKFQRLPRSDTPAPAEPWRDSRPQLPERRWRNPRGAA
jgi:hypothetical protein